MDWALLFGIIGTVTGTAAFALSLRGQAARGWIRRREIDRELVALSERHAADLAAIDERRRIEVEAIKSDHASRGMIHSTFYRREIDRAERRFKEEQAEAHRREGITRARLLDERAALSIRWPLNRREPPAGDIPPRG